LKKDEKAVVVKEMAEKLKRAKGSFILNYQGLNVGVLNALRKELRGKNSEFCVVKNRLLKIACEGTSTEAVKKHFIGPCALTISYDDVITPAKILVDQSKKIEKLKIKIGQIGGKVVDPEGIKRLAELPGREILLAQVLATLLGTPSSFVRVLNGTILNMLNVLKAIEGKKSEQNL
jgi:large subunit ribosomal protein L10